MSGAAPKEDFFPLLYIRHSPDGLKLHLPVSGPSFQVFPHVLNPEEGISLHLTQQGDF